jgi:hypothetical protein
MIIHSFRTSSYARNIYLYGTQSFASIAEIYVNPIVVHAAETFTSAQISNALANGWISEEAYNRTIEVAI